jgi:hypothetical protein
VAVLFFISGTLCLKKFGDNRAKSAVNHRSGPSIAFVAPCGSGGRCRTPLPPALRSRGHRREAVSIKPPCIIPLRTRSRAVTGAEPTFWEASPDP